jgi:outer membrane protein OmpA-like peptidoglycan-associated protein
LTLLTLALAACSTPSMRSVSPVEGNPVGSTSVPAGTYPGEPGARPGPSTPQAAPLVTEQRFLEEWFRGTPVVIAAQGPGALNVDVPLANSFDPGKADVKPALNAVLNRVAESLRRQTGARISVAAPADASGSALLSAQRTVRLRENLVAKGVALTRVALADAPPSGGPVQLRLTMLPPVARLENGALQVPAAGVKPVSATRATINEKR